MLRAIRILGFAFKSYDALKLLIDASAMLKGATPEELAAAKTLAAEGVKAGREIIKGVELQ